MSLAIPSINTVSATVDVVGTGDGIPVVRALVAAYLARHPDVRVIVPPSIGSGGGIAAVVSGKAMLARVARPLNAAERDNGLTASPVFRLPTAIIAHRDVPLKDLDADTLVAVFEGTVRNWKQVGGPDLPIRVVGREESESSFATLRQLQQGWVDMELTPRAKIAMTAQDAVESVRANVGAIGFGPYSMALENLVKVLSIDGVSARDSAYSSAITVSFVWREGLLSSEAHALVEFCTSQSARRLLQAFGALPAVRSPR